MGFRQLPETVANQSDEDANSRFRADLMQAIRSQRTGNLDADALTDLFTSARHAPLDVVRKPAQLRAVMDAARSTQRVNMVVMSVDMRKSTSLMKEAFDPPEFIEILRTFFDLSERGVRASGGWYDKYLGDGYLAYWLPENLNSTSYPSLAGPLKMADAAHAVWNSLEDGLRDFVHNWPSGAGLSVGLDAGPAYLAIIGNELTIMGMPVIGATRMVSAAKAGETLFNSHVGYDLNKQQADLQHLLPFNVEKVVRATKEYEQQDVFRIDFPRS